jgi:F-type H+-transporting ATPase subunit delta
MLDSIIAERYAKALFELAHEKGRLEQVKQDMELLIELTMGSREFKHLLVSPVIKPSKKVKVLDALLADKVDTVTKQFYHLIAAKRREKYLEGIARAFIGKYKEHNNIVTVEIRTVEPLTAGLRERIVSLIEKRREVTVDLVEITDPSLIGGFIVSTGNIRYDSSLATSIKKLKKEFEENLYVREF